MGVVEKEQQIKVEAMVVRQVEVIMLLVLAHPLLTKDILEETLQEE